MTIVEALSDFSTLSIVLFVAGIALLVIEMFLEGFGPIGITGLLLLFVDLIISSRSFLHGVFLGSMLLILLLFFFFVFLWLASTGRLPKKLILRDKATKKEGFSSTDFSYLQGQCGIAVSTLRPSGTIRTESGLFSAVSEGEFIPKDTEIVVKEVYGSRIVVERKTV